MLLIDDTLISDDIVQKQFMCNLKACKGACCHEGDYGAPLNEEEKQVLIDEYANFKTFLTAQGRAEIQQQGLFEFIEESNEWATTCIDNKACVFMTRTPEGYAACGIEQAHQAGACSIRKPISCALYPIRVESDEDSGFEALNYDRWDICNAACSLGKEKQMPIYLFVKDAIIQKWGQDFFDQLDALAKHLENSRDSEPNDK